MAGTPLRNLELFEKICGPKWFHRVVLVTTMWDDLWDPETEQCPEGDRRERELRETFWAAMISRGSQILRYKNSHESAWSILKSVRDDLGKHKEEPKHVDQKLKPRLQRETADKGRALPKTDAGHELYEQLNERERQRRAFIRTLDKQINRIDADDEVGDILRNERDQLKQESEAAEKDLGLLKVGASQRFLKSWGMKAKSMFSA
jgi:hypothetical protein